jgi:hypothetical protein
LIEFQSKGTSFFDGILLNIPFTPTQGLPFCRATALFLKKSELIGQTDTARNQNFLQLENYRFFMRRN